jgi:hypothetical protein
LPPLGRKPSFSGSNSRKAPVPAHLQLSGRTRKTFCHFAQDLGYVWQILTKIGDRPLHERVRTHWQLVDREIILCV